MNAEAMLQILLHDGLYIVGALLLFGIAVLLARATEHILDRTGNLEDPLVKLMNSVRFWLIVGIIILLAIAWKLSLPLVLLTLIVVVVYAYVTTGRTGST